MLACFVKPRRSRLRRSLRANALDGTLAATMVGFGEMFFSPVALFLKASPFQVGLLATLPMLIGSTFQLFATRLAHRVGEKHWVIFCAVTQSIVFFVVAALAWTQWHGYSALLVLVTVYWMLNLGLASAWNSWMGRMIPPSVRSRFLSRRLIPIQLFVFISIVTAGGILQASQASRVGPALGFVLCFAIAGLARAGSVHYLTLQHDPGKDLERAQPSLRGAIGGFRTHAYGRLILLIVGIQLSVNVSAPYFTPYWLDSLKLNYIEYTALTAISVIARVIAAPYWGEVARAYGNRRALQVALVLVTPLAALWMVSPNFTYMVVVQIVAGFAWAGYDLCHVLNLFDVTNDRNRAQVMSLLNLLSGVAIVTGSLLGGLVLRWLGDPGYDYLFALSTVGRVITLGLLAPGTGVKRATEAPFGNVFVRVITLRGGRA